MSEVPNIDLSVDNLSESLYRILTTICNDRSFLCINFIHLAFVIEKATSLFCYKVENLCCLFQRLLDGLIKPVNVDEKEDEIEDAAGTRNVRRCRNRGMVEEDVFFEIDNTTSDAAKPSNLDWNVFEENDLDDGRNSNYFSQSRSSIAVVSVSLEKSDDKIRARLREWLINENIMLVAEVFDTDGVTEESRFEPEEEMMTDTNIRSDTPLSLLGSPLSPGSSSSNEADFAEGEAIPVAEENSIGDSSDSEDYVITRNRRQEDNIKNRSQILEEIQKIDDLIPPRKLRPRNPIRKFTCENCPKKKKHQVCQDHVSLEDYLSELELENYRDSRSLKLYGCSPHQSLITLFQKNLKRQESEDKKKQDLHNEADEIFEEDFRDEGDLPCHNPLDDELAVPLPVVPQMSSLEGFEFPNNPNSNLTVQSRVEVLNSTHFDDEINEMLPSQPTQQMLEENVARVARWHDSIRDKLALSEKRGPLNIDEMASEIMSSFNSDENKPEKNFKEIVRGRNRRDISRMFLTCLQLTNEGNLDITPISKGNILLTRLRPNRIKELDEYTTGNVSISLPGATKRSRTVNVPSKRRKVAG